MCQSKLVIDNKVDLAVMVEDLFASWIKLIGVWQFGMESVLIYKLRKSIWNIMSKVLSHY